MRLLQLLLEASCLLQCCSRALRIAAGPPRGTLPGVAQTSDFASLPSPRPFLTYEPQPRFAEPKAVAVSMDGEFLELTRPPMTGELQVHGLHGDDEAPASDLSVEQC